MGQNGTAREGKATDMGCHNSFQLDDLLSITLRAIGAFLSLFPSPSGSIFSFIQHQSTLPPSPHRSLQVKMPLVSHPPGPRRKGGVLAGRPPLPPLSGGAGAQGSHLSLTTSGVLVWEMKARLCPIIMPFFPLEASRFFYPDSIH